MQRRPSLTEGKLMIMRALKAMEPLDENQLTEFFQELNSLTFFEIKEALSELMESELITPIRGELAPEAYLLTSRGREIYSMFSHSLPLPLRDSVDSLLPEWRRKFRRREQVRTRFFKVADGDYCALLEVYEHGAPAMELKLHLPDAAQARQAARGFELNAERLYSGIWKALDAEGSGRRDGR